MNKTQRLIIDLLNKLLNNKELTEINASDFDIDNLYKETIYYGVNTILHPVVCKCFNDSNFKKTLLKWTALVLNVNKNNTLIFKDIKYINKLFKEKNIPMIIFKGIAIAMLYDNPYNRFMSDIDILVQEKDWEESKKLLISEGFIQTEDDEYHPMHINLIKKGHANLELHRQLIHKNYIGQRDTEKWYNHIWSAKRDFKFDNEIYHIMCTEDELINQIIHFSTHFVFEGCKLSQLFEIALLIFSNKNIDWNYISDMLETLKFLCFGKLLFSICNEFFNTNIPGFIVYKNKRITYRFMNDLLKCFTEKNKDDIRGWNIIVSNYRKIINTPFLLPLAWAIELKSQFRLNGLKIHKVIKNTTLNIKSINRRIFYIRRFEIVNNHNPA